MGCGCGKRRSNRRQRLKALEKRKRKQRIKSNAKTKKPKKLSSLLSSERRSICNSCPHSIPTKEEKKLNIRKCHKLKRFINFIIKDFKTSCPIGKFKSI